jgi:hypothetical protein
MCEIIHIASADGLGPKWQYGVIAMRILCTQSGGGVGKQYPQIPVRVEIFDNNGIHPCAKPPRPLRLCVQKMDSRRGVEDAAKKNKQV